MKKDPQIFLQHILESIAHIEDYTADLTKGDYYDSTEKRFICISGASKEG